jgi:hypothetical protein
LSRELWWTGSPVAVFENENQLRLLRYLDGLVQGFCSILKNFLLLLERMCFEKYKMFYKITLHQILLFQQNILSSTYSMHLSDFPIPWVKVGCWVCKDSLLLICCFLEKEIADRVRVTPIPNHACGCWTADLFRCVYRAALAPL